MSDIEKELEAMGAELTEQPETPLPSLEEQKAIVARLKELEAKGELTPEILEEHFGQFSEDGTRPVH